MPPVSRCLAYARISRFAFSNSRGRRLRRTKSGCQHMSYQFPGSTSAPSSSLSGSSAPYLRTTRRLRLTHILIYLRLQSGRVNVSVCSSCLGEIQWQERVGWDGWRRGIQKGDRAVGGSLLCPVEWSGPSGHRHPRKPAWQTAQVIQLITIEGGCGVQGVVAVLLTAQEVTLVTEAPPGCSSPGVVGNGAGEGYRVASIRPKRAGGRWVWKGKKGDVGLDGTLSTELWSCEGW